MEARSNVAVDVSHFFLFEVTGDSSEVNSSVAEDYWADDDAQSCSCDTSDVQNVGVFCDRDDDYDNSQDERLGSRCCVGQDKGSGSEDEEEDGDEVNQSQNRQKESSKQGGSVELVSEKDGDRLFWEACLAS